MYSTKLILLLVSSLSLAACSESTNIKPIINSQNIVIAAEDPRPINTKPLEFVVVTTENREKLYGEPVWYAMTTKSYENLSYNIQEMIRYISQQQAQLTYYKNITANQ